MKNILLLSVLILSLVSCTSDEETVVEIKKPNILVVGNSIVLHPPRPEVGWNHNHGMVATSEDKDFYSILERSVPHNHIERFNVWAWEYNWDYSTIGRKTQPCDILIIKVGENVGDVANFDEQLNNLVNFYRDNDTKIYVVSTAIGAYVTEKDDIMEEFCLKNNYTFVNLREMQTDPSYFAWSEWEGNGGVGCHPSDKGMQYIANKIIEKI